MKCPYCYFESPPGMKFCGVCGARLGAPACPQCGAENPPSFKFCGDCGARLDAFTGAEEGAVPTHTVDRLPRRPPAQEYTPPHLAEQVFQSRAALEGERKQVTVLFCDLVGSTALAERVGPETMHLLLNQFFELALREVHRYEGTINQFLGDGFMALFGAPITHEDHPRRAVLGALGLRKGLEERRAELEDLHGVALQVRMGLNTGWVVVGGIGDHLRKDYTAIGDTTNLAARLQQIAEPGAILVSEATSRFLQGVQMKLLEPVHVKGKEAPVQAYGVLGAGAVQSEEAILGAMSRTPFVGRRGEMAILEELLERAEKGEGQVLGIAGEAGAGKSRLLYEFRRRLWNRSPFGCPRAPPSSSRANPGRRRVHSPGGAARRLAQGPAGWGTRDRRLHAGKIVGEMSFVAARPPSAIMRALEDSTVFAVSKSVLNAKLSSDQGFAARFYRALAIYLSTTVRERHRALGYGSRQDLQQMEEDDAGELGANVLDGVYLAGERFDRMVKRVMVA